MTGRPKKKAGWTRRERQIMDVLYRMGSASAAQVREALPSPPSYSAVRALLRLLEEKGHVRHVQDGPRYLFRPTTPRSDAGRTALTHLVSTFFDGSVEKTVSTLLSSGERTLTDDELDRLAELVDEARKRGR